MDSLSVKGAMGGGGALFRRDAGIRSPYRVRVQPVQPFLKFDIFRSFLRFGDPAEGVVPDKSFVSPR
jgi:hypothetical protein